MPEEEIRKDLLGRLAKYFTEGHAGHLSFTPAEVAAKLRELARDEELLAARVLSLAPEYEPPHIRPDTRPRQE